jgi:ABC-type dipeptide/oligopeptide/nickel transport system permease subunit
MQRPLLWLALIVAAVVIAPFFAPFDPMQTDGSIALQAPGNPHLFGTDQLGRDVLSRLLAGGRRTLFIAGFAAGITVFLGLMIGVLAGIAPQWLDSLLSILIDAVLAFPGFLLALVILTVLGAGGIQIAVATGAALIAQYARVSRSAVIAVRSSLYIEAARSAGATLPRIIRVHILPNILPTLLSYAGVMFSYSLLNSAALSFLGLGGNLGEPDWGSMLFDGRQVLRVAPWVSLAPGLSMTLIVLVVNNIADKLAQIRR